MSSIHYVHGNAAISVTMYTSVYTNVSLLSFTLMSLPDYRPATARLPPSGISKCRWNDSCSCE